MVWIHDDVRTLDASRLRAAGCLPDIIVGSPPCPAYSAANSRGRGLDDDPLFLEYIRLVGECRPVWCVAENSPNLRLRGGDRIFAALEALGYAVWPLVVGAVHAGANHRRKRCWVVAVSHSSLEQMGQGGQPWEHESVGAVDPHSDQDGCERSAQPDLGQETWIEASRRCDPVRLVADAALPGGAGLEVRQEQPARDELAAAERGVRADAALPTSDGWGQRRQGRFAPSVARQPESDPPFRWCSGEQRPVQWAQGLPDLSQLDDGPPLSVAHYGAVCAAQGDAIVPQVALPIITALRDAFPDARRVLDLFSGGVGGWGYACRWAGLEVVAACEADEWRRTVYRKVHHA